MTLKPAVPHIFMSVVLRQETVEQLLSNIFDKEKNESAIVSVIQILLTLFETRRPAYVLLPVPLLRLKFDSGYKSDDETVEECKIGSRFPIKKRLR